MKNQILYTACVTPFSKCDELIDYNSFEKLLKSQENAKNGILLLGSTGESLSLSDDEKRQIVNFACELKLDAEIIIGVPSYNLNVALDWIDFCNQLPINGYLMTTPIYTKPGIVGQTRWFEKLLDKSKHHSILYNIPGRSGIKLHNETVQNLASHPNFCAIKDSSGTIDSLVEYQIFAPNISVYCGDDYMMPSMATEGAIGLISVISNAFPKATRNYVLNSLQKNNDDKNKIWWQASKKLFTASNPIPIKATLKEIGIIENDTVRLPLNRDDLLSVQDLMKYQKPIIELEKKFN